MAASKRSLVLYDGHILLYRSLESTPQPLYGVLQGRTMLCSATEEHAKASKVQFAVALDKVDGVQKVTKENNKLVWLRSSANKSINFGFQSVDILQQDSLYRSLYIACLLRVPEDRSNLLPGQIKELKELVTKLKHTRSEAPSDDPTSYVIMEPCPPPRNLSGSAPVVLPRRSPSLPVIPPHQPFQPRLPNCMNLSVRTREESEQLLNEQTSRGNLMVRRRVSNDFYNYAVSVREPSSGKFRHFKLRQHANGSFSILLEEDHPALGSWDDVIRLFVERGAGRYKPINFNDNDYVNQEFHTYDTQISLDNGYCEFK